MATVMLMQDLPMPVVLRFPNGMSDAELIAFSERNKPMRFERNSSGEITIMSPVGGVGSEQEAYVCYELLHWTRNTKTGKAFVSNIGFNLPDGSCLSPDASWVALPRWEALTREERTGFPPLCPDFLIEVRSHSDVRKQQEDKMALWIENGAKLAWLIDPIDRTVTVYRAGEPTELLEAPEVVRGHAPVAGFELQMNPIWNLE